MTRMNRRSTMALGLSVAATPLFIFGSPARGAVPKYGPNDGKEIAPGVRVVELGAFNSDIPAYKSIFMVDIVFQPGAVVPAKVMKDDMVCYIAAGEFKIKKADKEFTVKEGEMYTCTKGKTDEATNVGKDVGIHRIGIMKTS